MQGTALQACVGGQELSGLGREGRSRDTWIKKNAKPLFIPSPPPVSTSLFFFFFFSLLFFSSSFFFPSDSSDWTGTGPWRWPMPPLLPFTRAPSGAYRIVVRQLRSGRAWADRFDFSTFPLRACANERKRTRHLIVRYHQRTGGDWKHTSPPPETSRLVKEMHPITSKFTDLLKLSRDKYSEDCLAGVYLDVCSRPSSDSYRENRNAG